MAQMMIFNHISFPFSLPSKLLRVVFRMIHPVFKPQDHLVNFIVDWDSKQGSHANPKILSTPIAGHPTCAAFCSFPLVPNREGVAHTLPKVHKEQRES